MSARKLPIKKYDHDKFEQCKSTEYYQIDYPSLSYIDSFFNQVTTLRVKYKYNIKKFPFLFSNLISSVNNFHLKK